MTMLQPLHGRKGNKDLYIIPSLKLFNWLFEQTLVWQSIANDKDSTGRYMHSLPGLSLKVLHKFYSKFTVSEMTIFNNKFSLWDTK